MQQFSPTTDKDLYVFHRSTAASIYLFPSMTSMRSSAVASYLRVMSALAMRYSLKMDLTESMSSSDWVHCDKKKQKQNIEIENVIDYIVHLHVRFIQRKNY